jgi:DNA-binding MarR family transcriptional regulator
LNVPRARLDEQLCFALYAASRAFTRAYAPLLGPLGLTYPQYLVLLVLWENEQDARAEGREQGGLSLRDLGERLGLDSGTLTPLLKRMEEADLVTRDRDREDERVLRVGLSRAGRALEKRAQDIPRELACRAGYEPDDASLAAMKKLRGSLRALAARLDASVKAS